MLQGGRLRGKKKWKLGGRSKAGAGTKSKAKAKKEDGRGSEASQDLRRREQIGRGMYQMGLSLGFVPRQRMRFEMAATGEAEGGVVKRS